MNSVDMVGNQHVFLLNWTPLAPACKKVPLLYTFHHLIYSFKTVEEQKKKKVKIWSKAGDIDITSASPLCAVTVYVFKRQLKENSFLLIVEEWMWRDLNEMHSISRDGGNSGCQKTASICKTMHRKGQWNPEERLVKQQLQLNSDGEESFFYANCSNSWL